MRRLCLALAALVMGTLSADAGLQRWSVLYLDANGNPTTYGKHKTAEAWAQDNRGYVVSIGCHPSGGHSLGLKAPDSVKADFAGPESDPSVRVMKPGTDLFLGPIGGVVFDGERYIGALPEPAVAPMRDRIINGQVMVSEFSTRTIVTLKTQSLSRAMAEVTCP